MMSDRLAKAKERGAGRLVSGPRPKTQTRSRQTRAERSETIRRALFRAAAEIVGEVGYADAPVSRITGRANVAQGTFYNYFQSRQDLFDQLLPSLGSSMLEFIKGRVDPDATGAERETQRITAYFQYLHKHPEFYRILYEAETHAPAAHRKHMDLIASGYVRALRRHWERGEMPGYEEHEFEPVAYVLLAARGYLSMRYGAGRDGVTVPDWVVNAYAKLIGYGLFAEPKPDDSPPGRSGRTKESRKKSPGRRTKRAAE
jgi:AcrR family transcriptional regulator